VAAGIPAPPVYVLDAESGINAFAAGSWPQPRRNRRPGARASDRRLCRHAGRAHHPRCGIAPARAFPDASAVQFTPNPAGISGALRKIAAEGAALASPRADEASHMLFDTGKKRAGFNPDFP